LGFTGCGKIRIFEGYGLEAVRNNDRINAALAAEGAVFALCSTFFRSLFSPCAFSDLNNNFAGAHKADLALDSVSTEPGENKPRQSLKSLRKRRQETTGKNVAIKRWVTR
jgi:hypothetical protein